ncbi:protein RD3-like [Gadus chalcogrammus]|uniref:protein RD3-like n=1 Tax=Gadus chalcogrammus TaxID=1042646 RepID=UPI0024C3F95A|nr:protein RD3-like [Gadus chalcogrammus]
MPLFSWMKWSREAEEPVKDEGPCLQSPGAAAGHMLLRELLWHVEERERLARRLEREHRLALGLRWFQKYPRLRTLIPAAELLHLEGLCSRVPPTHSAAVLSRFREALATDRVLPWEPVLVFKQVLGDFLSREELEGVEHSGPQAELRPTEAWTDRYQVKRGHITPTALTCTEPAREEIPTISGYVDRAMQRSDSLAGYRDWGVPLHFPVPVRATVGYSTTI